MEVSSYSHAAPFPIPSDRSCQVEIVQLDDETGEFKADPLLSFDHPYPPTKLMFIPDKECQKPDLLATTGDYLRIWQVSLAGCLRSATACCSVGEQADGCLPGGCPGGGGRRGVQERAEQQ